MAGKNQNEIIIVNSFKGGAGKTTLALTHCINDLFHERKYENVVYIDLDILGTATSCLFDKDKLPLEKSFIETGKAVEVPLVYDGENRSFHAVYLSPGLKMQTMYGGLNYVNHQEFLQQRLRDDILTYVRNIVGKRKGNLIVFDCAPGFSRMEQELLKACYDMELEKKAEVREEYVVTLDSAHIEKCIGCIRDSWEILPIRPEFRKVRLTMNDIQNYYRYASEDAKTDVEQQFREMAKEVRTRLQRDDDIQNTEIYVWRYSKEIAMRSIFMHQWFLENQVDDYIMTSDNYKMYEPI
jgi:cellulose biosynthesis protein BcsQ